jgi:hypothetical protein
MKELNKVHSDDKDFQLPFDISDLAPAERGWDFQQMVACDQCLRPNAPTRTSCLYCGAELPVTESTSGINRKPTLRPLDEWEKGFNVIILPSTEYLEDQIISELVTSLRLDHLEVKNIIAAKEPLPVVRASSFEEANLVKKILINSKLESTIISDEELGLDKLPKRIRRIEFNEENLTGWIGGGESLCVALSTLACIVTGVIFKTNVEIIEGHKRGSRSHVIDTREMGSDNMVLDIYTAEYPDGWRISMMDFDYSCLGTRKGLLVTENFKTLTQLIKGIVPHVVFKDSYRRIRNLLTSAWPLGQSSSAAGVRREKAAFAARKVMTSNNETQFTRYSRMQHLIETKKYL